MSPTGSPSAATSEDFEDSRGDHEDLEEYSEARGANEADEDHQDGRNTRLGLPDDLHFDPSDQETMEQHDQLQLILRLQSELAELKKQLATRAPRSPSMSDTSMETAPPSPKKPKIKDVRCSNFKGNEVYPGLGAGFENFIHEFEHAIRTEELVNGSTWTDDIKASVIVNFLEGKASRYYHKKNSEWLRRHNGDSMPYSDVKRAMRAEFGCKLSQLELSTKMQYNKREGDTWHDYLEYLNFIESLMEGDQTKMVMEVFGNNACPELAPTLLSSVPDDASDYVAETDRMKRLLYKLKGDGRRCGAKRDERKNRHADRWKPNSHGHRSGNRHNDDQHWRNQRNNNDNSDRRPQQQNNGQAFAAAGHRGEIHCHVCGKPGHKIFTCPLVEQAKQLTTRGSANVAAADDDDTSRDSDDEGYVWVAADGAERGASATRGNVWTVDSGATHHLCIDRDQLSAIEPAFLSVRVANGDLVAATEKGKTVITTMAEGVPRTVLLENVYFAKGIDRNLISVAQLTARGYTCTFGEEQCTITNKTGKIVAEVGNSASTGLWSVGIEQGAASFAAMTTSTLQQWHEHLGHVNYQDLVRMIDKNLVEGMVASNRKVDFCMNCAEAKQARRAKNKQDTSTSAPTDEPGATLCVDLKTDMTPDRLGHKHILTIVDHATNYNRVYLLRKKSDAEGHLEDFVSEFERQYDTKVKMIRSDGGGEFGSTRLGRFLRNRGILHQETEAGMSSSNGKAERFHRTVMDSARAMLWASALPQRFWGDAVLYASYIRNYLPTRANADHASPIEALSGKRPSVSHILKFGSKCTSHIAHATKRSAKKRAERGVVIGIDFKKKAYRVLIPRTKRVISTTHIRNVDRLDSRAVGRYMDAVDADNSGEEEDAGDQQYETNTPHDANGEEARAGSPAEQHQLTSRAIQRIFGLNRGTRALPRDDFRLPQSFLEEFATPASVLLTIVLKEGTAFAVLLERDGIKEPVTVEEAMNSPYWQEWWQAIEEELRPISKNATWEIVDIPTDGNLISAKWVFKLKFDNKGELERFKARLVARGFTQKFGIDFAETFAPVLKIASLRFIVALASQWHAVIRQGDVPNAYLRADLDRPIYMRAPVGLQLPKGKCLLLRKSLYGLKQSGKLWNDTIHRYLLELGFRRSQLDPCLYFRWHEGKLTVLGLYVDDVVVVSQREGDSDWTMQKLADQFQIKDMGPAKKCLGINIEQSDCGIYLHQTANIDGLLAKCGMENSRPVTTPMESTRDLNGEDSEPFYDTSIMRETIGSLLWISNCTRPDITMPVNFLARFVSTPTSTHWTAVKRILRYLRGSHELRLHFPRPQAPRHTIEAAIFSDADWAGGKDAKSTSGGLLTINAMPISWYSKKQSTVALSTAEAEYIAGATAVQDCLWVKQLLNELELHGKDDNIDLYIDNQSAIKNMENDVTTARMKHINIKFHFIRDAIRKKEVSVTYCPTTEMKTDIFTKPLGATLHGRNLAMIKLINPHNEKL